MLAPRPRAVAPVPSRPLMLMMTVLLMLAALPLAQVRVQLPPIAPLASAPTVAPDFGKLPLSFVPNVGQIDPAVRFQARGMGGTIFFTEREVVLVLPQGSEQPVHPDPLAPPADSAPRPVSVVRMQFVNANRTPTVSGAEQLPGIVNYFIGADPVQWRTNLPTYAGVVYGQLYDGIDLGYDGAEGRLKGTYSVAPGADPAQIAWRYAGAEAVRVDTQTGDLRIQMPGGATLTEHAPLAWQAMDGERVTVSAGYAVAGDGLVNFTLGRYDSAHPLVIDPTLVYSTYLGGSHMDKGYGIAVDNAGNAYITGNTLSTNFPTTNALQLGLGGNWDSFVTKLNAAGNRLDYSTFIGGSGEETGHSIAVDRDGNAYITGSTYSTNYPTANAIQPVSGDGRDVFITKLNSAGSALLFSTYFGGNGWDHGQGIAVDNAGNISVTGIATSTNFPTANAIQPASGGGADAFVVKLNSAGSTLLFSTYLGGSGLDYSYGIAVDSVGNVYITGLAASTNFPTVNAFQPTSGGGSWDVFVAKLSSIGNILLYSTYLGGSGLDEGSSIAVDSVGSVYVTGWTDSVDFPVLQALQPNFNGSSDAFVAKLSAAGSTLSFSTYLGGSDSDESHGIAVDRNGNAYITGMSRSTNFPTINALQLTVGGGGDSFVAKLNSVGIILYFSTYLGGSSYEISHSIAVDDNNNAFVTGETLSTNYPIVNALQPVSGGSSDAFVTKRVSNIPRLEFDRSRATSYTSSNSYRRSPVKL